MSPLDCLKMDSMRKHITTLGKVYTCYIYIYICVYNEHTSKLCDVSLLMHAYDETIYVAIAIQIVVIMQP